MAAAPTEPGLPPGSVTPRPPAERGRRWFLRPTTFVLALICFTLPFLTVSCTKPGGYGRVEAGGTTSYSGFDLAFGGDPRRSADHLLPADRWRPDTLGVQPLLWLALAFVVAGLVIPFVVGRIADRERASAGAAGLAMVSIVAGAWVERVELADRIAADAAARKVVLDHPAATYVGNGQGLVLAVLLMAGTLVVELVVLNGRRRAGERDAPPGSGRAEFAEPRPAEPDPRPKRREIGSPWEVVAPAATPATVAADRAPADRAPEPPAGSPSTPVDPR